MAAVSCGDATTPSRPDGLSQLGEPHDLIERRCRDADGRQRGASRLVSTVTAITSGAVPDSGAAVRPRRACAASIIGRPPLAWTFTIHTPRSAADRIAPATVFGMS